MGMGFTGKNKSSSEGWGMGFLFVFFPDEYQNHEQEAAKKRPRNPNPFSSSHKRTNPRHLLHRAQSTISVCLLLIFTTALLFTLSTLPSSAPARRLPRRQLSPRVLEAHASGTNLSRALQGMGTLYRRGTRAMTDLVVAHAVESLALHELKLFLRLFHRSSLASRSDLLFIFRSKTSAFDDVIIRESDSFSKLLAHYGKKFANNSDSHSTPSFEVAHFIKPSKKDKDGREPIWGRRIRANLSEARGAESTRPSYGSVVGFDVEELDPENSLSGFLDHVPMNLRRWACYPMLLGRVRRNFKHVMLVDIKEMLLLGDPLVRVRSPESVILKVTAQSTSPKNENGKKNPDKSQTTRKKPVHPGIIMGGSRGIRRLSNELLVNIVRASMQQRKNRNPVTESGLFRQLVENEVALKNVNLIVSAESIPELSSVSGSSLKPGSPLFMKNYSLIRRGNSNFDVNSVLMKHLCSFPMDSTVYSDCQ